MNIKEYQNHFSSELSELFPKTEIDSFFSFLIEEYLELKRIDLVINTNFEISSEKLDTLNSALLRLKQEEPIQYIIGKTEFYGFPFYVNQNVLIPRPETEELVEWVIKDIQEKREKRKDPSVYILDIGTGSGCIPISLKKQIPSANISSIDVSKKAIETAKKNAELNEVTINFIQQDILQTEQLTETYDIIISNPPYVRELEKAEMKKNVLDNEPKLALFVKDHDPLIFYRKIAQLAKAHLKEGGSLFFEINQYLGKETIDLLHETGFKNTELRKDLFENDRMIKATF